MQQEDFKPLAKRMRGFEYRAERPDRQDPVDQKWGYVGEEASAQWVTDPAKEGAVWGGGGRLEPGQACLLLNAPARLP